jgi:hypothetical protein
MVIQVEAFVVAVQGFSDMLPYVMAVPVIASVSYGAFLALLNMRSL